MELNIPEADRVILPFKFDTEKMLADVDTITKNSFEYYNVIQLRGPAHLIDTSLPSPPPASDYADGSWTDWIDSSSLKQSSYIESIIQTFKEHTKVTLVRLLRLAPNSVVAEHTDPTLGLEVEKSVIRLTIPIQNDDNVKFFLNGTHVPMNLGECWYMRLSDPHEVHNESSIERINLTIDMIPNEWVREMILEASLNPQ